MSEKEYIFIGNAQNKTRDYIKQIEKDNREKDKEIEKLHSIIKEVREFVEKRKDTQIYFKGTFKDNGIDRQFLIEQYDDILEILDKVGDK